MTRQTDSSNSVVHLLNYLHGIAQRHTWTNEQYLTANGCTNLSHYRLNRIVNTRHIATDLLHAVRAVQIELFTARVLRRTSHRVLEYSTDTESGYKL